MRRTISARVWCKSAPVEQRHSGEVVPKGLSWLQGVRMKSFLKALSKSRKTERESRAKQKERKQKRKRERQKEKQKRKDTKKKRIDKRKEENPRERERDCISAVVALGAKKR